jgi:ParB family chromosome partitioning protein
MARKHNLLMGLSAVELPAGNSTATPVENHGVLGSFGGGRGAVGAVSRSLEHMRTNTVHDLDTDLIDHSIVADRLEFSPESQAELVASIKEHGQQVPILVRPHPGQDGRYQVAYGHRRLRAAIALKRTVRAVVKNMTDDELVVAQGQENSARTDLSFIERARFAATLEGRGFKRETIMAALSVDKTGLSRLISAAVKIPGDILDAIGAAPKTGRDRWVDLAVRLERPAAMSSARKRIAADGFSTSASDERFAAVFAATEQKIPKGPAPTVWKAPDGKKVARIRNDERQIAVIVDKKIAGAFGSYLIEQLPEIYAAFVSREEA